MNYKIDVEDTVFDVQVEALGGRLYRVSLADRDHRVDVLEVSENLYSMICDGRSYEVDIVEEGNTYEIFIKGKSYMAEVLRPEKKLPLTTQEKETTPSLEERTVTTPMSSKVIKVLIAAGDTVEIDQVLLIVEAMKMEMPITSPIQGKVQDVLVKEGQILEQGEKLVTLRPLQKD
jgi:biotin carboxyl carrier protein